MGKDHLERRKVGRTGLSVSSLGFGAAPIGLLETEQQQAATLLNQLLDSGINVIDTAAGYAGSEETIGKAISHRRSEYVLISKCGRADDELPGEAWSEQLILATVDRALKRLKTDHLDVMLLHSCDLETLKKGEAIGALAKARQAGKIRFAGYSGDNEAAVFGVSHPEVSVLETSINIVDQRNIDLVLPVAVKHDVGVLTKRSIANAAWKPMTQQAGFYKEYAQEYHQRFQAMSLTSFDAGGGLVTDWAETALRFTLAQPGVSCVLIGTTNPENARRNMEIAAKPPLGPEVIQRLREVFASTMAKSGKDWPALT